LFNQGRCYQQNAEPAQALAKFKEFIRKGKDAAPEDIKDAQEYIRELEADVDRSQGLGGAKTMGEPASGGTGREAPAGSLAGGADSEPAGRRRLNSLQLTGVIVGGVGVVALGAGVFFSIKVQSTERDVNGLIKGQTLVEAGTLKDRDRLGARYELLQWIGYAVGLVGVTAGATTFYLGTRERSRDEAVAITVLPVFSGDGGAGTSVLARF
jgi:serine/threonine-protein kinase